MTWTSASRMLITYVVMVVLALLVTGLVLGEDASWWHRLLFAWLPASIVTHAVAGRLGWWTRS